METVEQLIEEWRKCVPEYAAAKANMEYLSHFRQAKIAILMGEAEQQDIKTAAAQERWARAHKEYLELLDGYKVAIELSESLRLRMKIAENRVEIWRTKSANNRREKNMYGA